MSCSFLACVGFMVDQRALNPLIRQTPYFAGVGGGIRTFGKICLFARLRGLFLLPSRGVNIAMRALYRIPRVNIAIRALYLHAGVNIGERTWLPPSKGLATRVQ